MSAVVEHISRRAEATPALTAVRHSGGAVTFGSLDEAIGHYWPIVTAHGMADSAALVAGLLHSIPTVAELPSAQVGDAIRDMLMWIGRDIDGGQTSHLHAVS